MKIVPIEGPRGPRMPTRTLHIGIWTPYKITVEGDRTLCKCTYTDRGYFTYKFRPADFPNPEQEGTVDFGPEGVTQPTDGGCVDGEDYPGLKMNIGPLPGSGSYVLDYHMTVTVTCIGSDKHVLEDSKPITGSFEGNVSWPEQTGNKR
jgi:hypothetical protein